MSSSPLKCEPAGTATLSTRSAVIACASRLTPRGGLERFASLSAAPGCVACSMPDGRDGGRGGKPFSCASSSRNAWFSVRSAAWSDCSRRISPTRRSTTSRNSASENASSDAASGNVMQRGESRHQPLRNQLAWESAPVADCPVCAVDLIDARVRRYSTRPIRCLSGSALQIGAATRRAVRLLSPGTRPPACHKECDLSSTFRNFGGCQAQQSAQKMSSDAINWRASSRGRTVPPKGPAATHRFLLADQ